MVPKTARRAALGASEGPNLPEAGRGALTLVETVIFIVAIGVSLFLMVGWTDGLRRKARRELTVRVLADLDQALARYHRATGQYPHAPEPDPAHWAVTALLDNDRTHPILDALPPIVWRGGRRGELIDAWGTPLRYLPEHSDSPYVKTNGGRPLFISAGPDRDFGSDEAPEGLGDNLRSDDPGRDGSRLHDVMRESISDEEAANAKKNH